MEFRDKRQEARFLCELDFVIGNQISRKNEVGQNFRDFVNPPFSRKIPKKKDCVPLFID